MGTVIEAEIDRAKGVLATLLVQNGTLEVGDVVIAGERFGRLRAMFDFRGKRLRKAGPATPVSVMGLNDVPLAGEQFERAESEKEARAAVEARKQMMQQSTSGKKAGISLEQLFDRFQAGDVQQLPLIIKADVQGSLEPIESSVKELSKEAIKINILYAETGNIGENDIMLAAASKAIVIGFNVQADAAARRLAEAEGISIRLYDIIYRLTEDLEKALKGMLAPTEKEVVIGHAEVRQVFRISKLGFIAGCKVMDGELRRNAQMRVLRRGEAVFTGGVASLKHLQDDVREVRQGLECGVGIKNFEAFEVGDQLECFFMEKSS
jgi:translation initiation factor IF-2